MRRLLSSLGRVLWVPLLLAGCGEQPIDGQERGRPGIDPGERICGPVEVGPMGRAERFLHRPDGEIYLVGNSYNRFRQAAGKVVQFDPTGALRPLLFRLGWSVDSMALTDRGLVTAMDRGHFVSWPEMQVDTPVTLGAFNWIQEMTTRELLPVGEDFVAGGITLSQGEEAPVIFKMHPADQSITWYHTYTNNRLQPAIDGRYVSIAARPDGDIVAVGRGLSVIDWTSRYGFYVRVDAEDGTERVRRDHPQKDFEPVRLVHDRAGELVVLAIEGHEGVRYERARPFLARFDRNGDLVDKLRVPLPQGTAQGAVLSALPMRDGGWILGGSACGEQRAWCQAWVVRIDRRGEVKWSRMVPRNVAATVNDLTVVGNRLFAAISSSYYCCEFDELDYDVWLWELDLDGNCPLDPALELDGTVFR